MCKVVFDSATKVEPRNCSVNTLTLVSDQVPFEPSALPDAPALLHSLVKTLDWIALNAQVAPPSPLPTSTPFWGLS